ncbi:hypothetical protein LO763_11385 [Glycomyces sp. A-F 0318]|uniref:hypothetical protein n=1 Tax=Glycomyces amatae TaxID=2881355 RepID=UPI001E32E191|nr:hypothetical protein [Glycomyces amatae]MCD0444225.1 hypothetical protein [Glycomyces amatae]
MSKGAGAALAAQLGLRTAGELTPAAQASEPVLTASRRILPVTSDIAGLLPHGGLAATVAITAARRGATALMWRLLAGPSRAGAWCALVGLPGRYPLAAAAAGARLDRIVFVEAAGPRIADAAGALAEGVAVMVVPSEGLSPAQARRLTAQARRGGTIVIWWETRPVAGPDARLEVTRVQWRGLRANTGRRWGPGRLTGCQLDVATRWRSGGGHRSRLWPYGGAPGEPADIVAPADGPRSCRGEAG